MKRILIVFIVALAALSFASAQTVLSSPVAKDARSMGLGGSFTSLSTGYDSLFGNPADFASSKGQFTLPDLAVWGYVRPTQANYERILAAIPAGAKLTDAETAALIGLATDLITTNDSVSNNNGLGAGFLAGFGYTRHGLGLGAYAIADAVASGEKIEVSKVAATASVNAVCGFGIPIQLGAFTLSVGADIRPFVRIDSDDTWLVTGLLGAVSGGDSQAIVDKLMSEQVYGGFGLAVDFGTRVQLGSLAFGLSLRDFTPSYVGAKESLSDFLGDLKTMNFTTTDLSFDPTIAAGLAWQPVLVKNFLEPGIYAEVKAPLSEAAALISGTSDISPWNYVHVGADLKLLSIIDIRAGLNQGYICAGLGLNFAIIELNAAFFTYELGDYPGESGRSGVSLQASFHI
jgi:hypothetical protein